jgi:hypothetical protein
MAHVRRQPAADVEEAELAAGFVRDGQRDRLANSQMRESERTVRRRPFGLARGVAWAGVPPS